jgi:hypothetical protein
MEATVHHHAHHEMPTSGRAITVVALSATLHCLTGCAIGEILGMVIGTALGFSDLGTIALAVALAFLFGYALTSLPLLRAGFAFAAVVPIALASDTASIAVMEIVDNAILLLVPGAMEAGLGDVLFWGSLSVALVVAGAFALPLNRWLIARGKGHAVVHETGIHGGPSPRVVGAIAVVAAVFGTAVLVGELVSSGDEESGGDGPPAHSRAAEQVGQLVHGCLAALGGGDREHGRVVRVGKGEVEEGAALRLRRHDPLHALADRRVPPEAKRHLALAALEGLEPVAAEGADLVAALGHVGRVERAGDGRGELGHIHFTATPSRSAPSRSPLSRSEPSRSARLRSRRARFCSSYSRCASASASGS